MPHASLCLALLATALRLTLLAAPQFASPCLLRRGVGKQGPCAGHRGEKEAADRRGGAARRGVARSRGGEWGAAASGLGVGTGEGLGH